MRRTRKTKYRKLRRTYKKQRGGRSRKLSGLNFRSGKLGTPNRVGSFFGKSLNKLRGRRAVSGPPTSSTESTPSTSSTLSAQSARSAPLPAGIKLCTRSGKNSNTGLWGALMGNALSQKESDQLDESINNFEKRSEIKDIVNKALSDNKITKVQKPLYINYLFKRFRGGYENWPCHLSVAAQAVGKRIHGFTKTMSKNISRIGSIRSSIRREKKKGGFLPKKRILLNSTRRKIKYNL